MRLNVRLCSSIGAIVLFAGLALAPTFGSGAPKFVIGSVIGSAFHERNSGDLLGLAAYPAIAYTTPFRLGANYRLDVEPKTPYSVQYPPFVNSRHRHEPPYVLQIRMRAQPNRRYDISVADVYDYSGHQLPPVRFSIRTSAAPMPLTPIVHRRTDFFCSLLHPANNDSLPTAREISSKGLAPRTGTELRAASVRCARFGPIPNVIATDENASNWNWKLFDGEIKGALKYGVIPNPLVLDAQAAPSWATGGGYSISRTGAAFQTPKLYAKYVIAVLRHVKKSFPQIHRFECGVNEPNARENFNNSTWKSLFPEYNNHNGRGIAPFLALCYRAVHFINNSYEVDAPGIASGVPAYDFLSFVDNLYSAGCAYRKCWDVLTIHEYPWSDPTSVYDSQRMTNLYGIGKGVSLARSYRLLQREAAHDEALHGMHTKDFPVAITEFGYSSSLISSYGVDEALQATYTAGFLRLATTDPSLRYVVWSNVADQSNDLFGDISLYNADDSKKRAWFVWKAFATY